MHVARLALGSVAMWASAATADPRPTLDEFFERTREREDGFETCMGYCDGRYLASFLVGAQTANPSVEAAEPRFASGLRLGVAVGARDERGVMRGKLWADVLRVNADGTWITDLAGQTTAFRAFGRPGDDVGLHLSFDGLAAQRTELRPSDVARLQRVPYRSFDTEVELAPLGPRIDKDGSIALPVGVAYRLRTPLDGGAFQHRTTISGALAYRGFPKHRRTHAQLDFLRVKHTRWDVPGGEASATTMSAGYQRLPVGIDTLPLWALVGYQWAGERSGVVAQVGMDLPLSTTVGELSIAPSYERHFELDPDNAMFRRVSTARMALGHRLSFVRWGVGYDAAFVEDAGSLHAITPELALSYQGFELGVQYRFTVARDAPMQPMSTLPRDRLSIALDRAF